MNSTGKIVQLVNPTANQDAATKSYVDTKFTTVPTPTNTNDAANKGYVDTSIPVGGIIMWSGTIASIPTNWRLCDGTNGTPNLTNRFIIGASIDTATTGTGGSNSVTRAHTSIEGSYLVTGGTKDAVVVSHNHGGYTNSGNNDGAHSHSSVTAAGGASTVGNYPGSFTNSASFSTGNAVYNSTLSVASSGSDHYHVIASQGESGTNKNLPPYYALAFIMRVS